MKLLRLAYSTTTDWVAAATRAQPPGAEMGPNLRPLKNHDSAAVSSLLLGGCLTAGAHLLVPFDVLVCDVVHKQLVEGTLGEPELQGVEQHFTRTL
jgi:hypothetical protein